MPPWNPRGQVGSCHWASIFTTVTLLLLHVELRRRDIGSGTERDPWKKGDTKGAKLELAALLQANGSLFGSAHVLNRWDAGDARDTPSPAVVRAVSNTKSLASTVSAHAIPPMTTPPSLQEQQLRFMAAKHLMAVRAPRRRDAFTQLPVTGDAQPQHKILERRDSAVAEEEHATRKRGRRRSSKTTASLNKETKPMASPPLYVPAGAPPAQTPRKSAYVLQKEQRNDLADQVRELEERVERLRLQAGLPTKADRQEVTDARHLSVELDECIHTNRQYAVRLQSMVKEKLQMPPVNPLATYIHLPCDQAQRRAILLGMKYVKLRRATEIGVERFRHLEGNASYLCEERYTTDDVAFHCNRWEINEFSNFRSAKQMYDALLFWIYNMEISVTEMANQIAVREDDQDIEPTIWNHRIITTTEDVGCTEELNLVGFAKFYDRHPAADGAPLGVITYTSVDVDDLYPYKPLERTRKEVQAYHLFCEFVDPETQRKSILLKTCLLNAQLPPQFPVEQRVIDKLHEYMSRWIVLMNQYLSEYTVAS